MEGKKESRNSKQQTADNRRQSLEAGDSRDEALNYSSALTGLQRQRREM
jgi:hypothetical protein